MIPNKNKTNHNIHTRSIEKSVKGQLINDRPLSRVIKKFTEANEKENNHRFDVRGYQRELESKLSKDRAAAVIDRGLRPHQGGVLSNTSPTAQDLGREERKLLKRRMRSRR